MINGIAFLGQKSFNNFYNDFKTPSNSSKDDDWSFDSFEKFIEDDRKERLETKKRLQEIREKRRQREIRRKKQAFKKRAAVILALLGITTSITVAKNTNIISNPDFTSNQLYNELHDSEADTMEIESETVSFPEAESESDSEKNINKVNQNTVEKILENDAEAKEAYELLDLAKRRFSKQLGEDGIKLIKKRVKELGNGRVDALDVLKILWIESNGLIYDDNGNYIVGYTNEAYGPFQLTYDTQDYINSYFNLNEDNKLDLMNPKDNLDLCVYNLRILNYYRNEQMNTEGLPVNNLKDAIVWGYHDGAWATSISANAMSYIEQYNALSSVDKYPELVEALLNEG